MSVVETAVGDRWLSAALRTQPSDGRYLKDNSVPACMGCEDSGHIVLPVKHPHQEKSWSLVGDGIVTLLSVLSARVVINEFHNISPAYEKGWKKRISVKDTDRSKWNGKNELSEQVYSLVKERLGDIVTDLRKEDVDGENNLLMIKGEIGNCPISIGIRNSGTEAKTSISIRTAPNMDNEKVQDLETLVQEIYDLLKNALKNN